MTTGKPLTALVGGLKPEIRVIAKAGSLLNLHFKDSSIILKTYQLGSDETTHTFVVSASETAYVVDDATNGASVEVLVDAVAQYNAEIKYGLLLYRDGDECEDITGGWSSGYSYNNWTVTSATKSSDGITIATPTTGFCPIGTNNKINVTDYAKVKFNLKNVVNPCYVRVTTTTNLANATAAEVRIETGMTEVECDVSGLTGEYYISIAIVHADQPAYSLTMTKAWLE